MSGKKINALDVLTLPLLQDDERVVGRGTKSYRTKVINPVSDDPLTWWEKVDMPVYINGTQSSWYDALYAPELKTLFAVAGLNGGSNRNVIAASRDGRKWAGRSDDSTAVHKGIAWAPSIPLLCIAGEAGSTTSARIRTSPDGYIWTERSLPTINQTLRCIAWSPTLSLFVAMGTSNSVFTSPDGVTWTSRTGPVGGGSWRRVIWCGGTVNKFYAMDGNNVASSSNGTTWSAVTFVFGGNGQGFAFSPTLNRLVFTDANSNNFISHSDNGTTWNNHTVGPPGFWHDCAWSPLLGKFITIGGRNLAHSADGITWTLVTQSALPGNGSYTRLIATQ
jgi:hypothetical protein